MLTSFGIKALSMPDKLNRVVDGFDGRIAGWIWLFTYPKCRWRGRGKTDAWQRDKVLALSNHFFCGGPSSVDNKDSELFLTREKIPSAFFGQIGEVRRLGARIENN